MKKPFKRFQTEYFLKIRKIPTMQSTVSDIKRCFLIQEETMNRKKYYYEITDAAGVDNSQGNRQKKEKIVDKKFK